MQICETALKAVESARYSPAVQILRGRAMLADGKADDAVAPLHAAAVALLAIIHEVAIPRDHLHATGVAATEELLAAVAIAAERIAFSAKQLVARRARPLQVFTALVT